MSQREDLEEQDLQQRRNQISEAFGEYNAHEVRVSPTVSGTVLMVIIALAYSPTV